LRRFGKAIAILTIAERQTDAAQLVRIFKGIEELHRSKRKRRSNYDNRSFDFHDSYIHWFLRVHFGAGNVGFLLQEMRR